jgi:hypothetical protein
VFYQFRSHELLLHEGIYAPQRVRFISRNIFTYCPSERGSQGQSSWKCNRDQTQCRAEFEKAEFRTNCPIVLTPNHTYAALDDELYGARATDNLVKTFSVSKADSECHCADAIDDLFRINGFERFRQRGHTQTENVNQLLNCALESRGEKSFHDRG